MPDLRHTRKNLKIALGIMVAVDLIAIAIYVSPLIGSTDSRRQELNRLQGELILKTKQVAPLQNLPLKVQLASRQISDFYRRRFPTNESEIPTELGKLASPSGVTIEQVRYKVKEEGAGRLIPVEIEADLAGNYTNLAKFINAMERDDMFFIITSVNLGGQPTGPVKLNVKLETYLKAGT
jgi:type IV pilus assembly protein PilO